MNRNVTLVLLGLLILVTSIRFLIHLLKGRFGTELTLIIGAESTTVIDSNSGNKFDVENKLALQFINGEESVIAIGSPKDWGVDTPNKLPNDARIADLLSELDEVLLENFIKYCRIRNRPDYGLLHNLYLDWAKLTEVKICIKNARKSIELSRAIQENKHLGNIKLVR